VCRLVSAVSAPTVCWVDQWVSPRQAVRLSAADADGLVPLGDERLDEMLAGGLRAGELCGLYADVDIGLGGVRRVLAPIISHCATRVGPVLYFALTPAAAGVRDKIVGHLGSDHARAVLAAPARRHSIEEMEDRAGYYADRNPFCLILIDQLDAIDPDTPDADGWEQEAQITRDLKAFARSARAPILVTCTEWIYPGSARRYRHAAPARALPTDPLVAAADILLQTNGRYIDMVKNRHGTTHLYW
jgi:hypothetical protein